MPNFSRANPNNGPRPGRGNSYDRRRRKQWLLDTYGDGTRAQCWRCDKWLTLASLTVDRIVFGAFGGTYRRDNIRPACLHCNCADGAALGNELRKAA
jgi:5-methylcytosine-specific restriction endonuclease McrA